MKLADTKGLETVTMRNLADRLGVEAMSIYHYLPSKEALLYGMDEWAVSREIVLLKEVEDETNWLTQSTS